MLTSPPTIPYIIDSTNSSKHIIGTKPLEKLLGNNAPVTLSSIACGIAEINMTPATNKTNSISIILKANFCCIENDCFLAIALATHDISPLLTIEEYVIEQRMTYTNKGDARLLAKVPMNHRNPPEPIRA